MASVGSNHSNSRLLAHDSRRRQCDGQELEMRVPLQPHRKHENYENMDTLRDDPSHQYEDPGRFQDDAFKGPKLPARKERGTPRKKKNDVYEAAKHRQRRYTDSSSEGSYDGPPRRDPCWRCVRVMVFFIFFLALSALVLIGMIVLGYVPIKACGGTACSAPIEVPQSQTAPTSAAALDLAQRVNELSANVKELQAMLKKKKHIIEGLQKQEEEQAARMAKLESIMPLIMDRSGKLITNLTAVVGPRGPSGVDGLPGPPGPQGLPGEANLSACYYSVEKSSPTTTGGSPSVSISEEEGKRIMSASCSTEGASEYNLKSQLPPDGRRMYICECKGTSRLFTTAGTSFCYIHYWTCPV